MTRINDRMPASGRLIKENGQIINYADMIEALYNAFVVNKDAGVVLGGAEISVSAELEAGSLVGLVSGTEVALVAGTEVVLADETVVGLIGNTLAEQKTQANAVENVITFSENINVVEIYHAEETWQTFVVNGLSIVIPAGGYRTPIAGVPGLTVTIPATVNCIVGRLV